MSNYVSHTEVIRGGRLHQETRHWGTVTGDLLAMADWMTAQGVTQVVGIPMKPIGIPN